MFVDHVHRWMALIVLLAPLAITSAMPARAQSHDELATLRTKMRILHNRERYGDAIPLAERYLALVRKKYGKAHTEYASALNNLAELYRAQRRYAAAERLYKRSLALREKARPPDNADV